jgi:hypothetical protein
MHFIIYTDEIDIIIIISIILNFCFTCKGNYELLYINTSADELIYNQMNTFRKKLITIVIIAIENYCKLCWWGIFVFYTNPNGIWILFIFEFFLGWFISCMAIDRFVKRLTSKCYAGFVYGLKHALYFRTEEIAIGDYIGAYNYSAGIWDLGVNDGAYSIFYRYFIFF